MQKKQKIGQVTLWNYNYGSVLQCYATQQLVRKLGYDCQLIYRNETGINKYLFILSDRFKGYIKYIRYPKYIKRFNKLRASTRRKSSNMLSKDNLNALQNFINKEINSCGKTYSKLKKDAKTDAFAAYLSGSDQVWNVSWFVPNPVYFLRFAPKEKRIAWAPSFGIDKIAKYNYKKFKKYIAQFAYLSSREQQGVSIIKQLTGRDAVLAIDPVLALDAEFWREKIYKNNTDSIKKQPYIFTFFLNEPNKTAINALEKIKAQTNMNHISFAYHYKSLNQNDNMNIDGSPWDFLNNIANAQYILTDSFHALTFAMQFKIPFYVFDRQYTHDENQNSRIKSILDLCNVSNRMIFNIDDIDIEDLIDFKSIHTILEKERNKTVSYLKNALYAVAGKPEGEVYNDNKIKR